MLYDYYKNELEQIKIADILKIYSEDESDVTTKVLNQAVKRNLNRFPGEFRFQLSDNKKKELVTNCDRLEKLKHSSVNPYAFTEQGVAMLSLNWRWILQILLVN